MSHTKVKTSFKEEGNYSVTSDKTLYCHHNHSNNITSFYYADGELACMCFQEWGEGYDLWDAMQLLWSPFVDEWGGELKGGVEYYKNIGE